MTPAERIADRHGVSVAVLMGRAVGGKGRAAQAEFCSLLRNLGLEEQHVASVFGRGERWVRDRVRQHRRDAGA